MSGITYSTIVQPAIKQVLAYMKDVRDTLLPDLNITVYVGTPTPSQAKTANTLSLGLWTQAGANIVSDYNSDWQVLPATAKVRVEPFQINWSIMAWHGDDGGDPDNPLAMQNAFAMYNAMLTQFVSDPVGSGSLGASGTWAGISFEYPLSGPVEGGGNASVLECSVKVRNATTF